MSIPPPNEPSANPNRPGAPADKTEVEPPFEEQLRQIWEKKENRNAVLIGCIVVVVVIIGWYAWKALAAERENQVQAAYSAAVSTPRLRAFALEHQGHPLAGVAYLRLADDAFAAGDYTAAIGDYEKALVTLPAAPFVARALLGKGMCQIRSGKTAEGVASLQQLAEDPSKLKTVRCEAAYHLAALAFDGGNFGDVTRFTDLVMQVDAGGIWAQRAMQLRSKVPETAKVSQAPAVLMPGQVQPAAPAKVPGS
jgi:hypothetical protein